MATWNGIEMAVGAPKLRRSLEAVLAAIRDGVKYADRYEIDKFCNVVKTSQQYGPGASLR